MLPQIRGRLLAVAELSAGLAAVLDGTAPELTPLESARALVALDGMASKLERLADSWATRCDPCRLAPPPEPMPVGAAVVEDSSDG